MESEKTLSVAYEAIDAGPRISGAVEVRRSPGWDSLRHGPDPTRTSLVAPGVVTPIGVARGTGGVFGSQIFGDGILRSHPGLAAVGEESRRKGNDGGLVDEAFARMGAERTDLIAPDEGLNFRRTSRPREQVGFGVHPGRGEEGCNREP